MVRLKITCRRSAACKIRNSRNWVFLADTEYVVTSELTKKEQEVVVCSAINQFEGFIKLNKLPGSNTTNGIDEAARLYEYHRSTCHLNL